MKLKKKITYFFVILEAILGIAGGVMYAGTDSVPGTDAVQRFVPNQVVVKLSSRVTAVNNPGSIDILKEANLKPERVLARKYHNEIKNIKRHSTNSAYHVIETYNKTDVELLCKTLENEPTVIDASPNYYAYIDEVTPDDPRFSHQYYLRNTGQVYEEASGYTGTAGSDIKASGGWEWHTGTDSIIVAVVDSGVNGDVEDLTGKLLPGRNYVDESHNTDDDHGHGTAVASIIAANTNNGTGIAGICWGARILPVKVAAADGYASYLAIGEGIRYSADQGAHVINVSIGGRGASFILEDACEYAHNQGSVIVCSAGNYDRPVHYPAAYEYCIAVGASTQHDERATWSNYGPELDVMAPGYKILAASYVPQYPNILNEYRYMTGTSYAAPQVSGAAALLLSYKPFLTNAQVMDLIKYTADDINSDSLPGRDDTCGYGRINIQRLLEPFEL